MTDIALERAVGFGDHSQRLLILDPLSERTLQQTQVCRGWRRSWLAAARNRDLARLASSAACLVARSCAARLRSVTSLNDTRILSVGNARAAYRLGRYEQRPLTERRPIDRDLTTLGAVVRSSLAIEKRAQRRGIEVMGIEAQE